MSWQLPSFRLWSYAFTFASGGLVATILLRSHLHPSSLNAPNDRTKKHALKQDAPLDSVDARSLTDPTEKEKIDGGVKFLKKMLADKCGNDNEQQFGADDLHHEHREDDPRHVLITTQNPDGKIIRVRAFLDTGCDGNLISQSAVQRFGLETTQGEEHSWITGSGAEVRSRQEVVLPYVATQINDKTIRVPFAMLDTLPDDVEDIILGNKFLLQAHYITFNPALADIVDLNYSNKPSSPTLMQMTGRAPGFAGFGQHSQARRSNERSSKHR